MNSFKNLSQKLLQGFQTFPQVEAIAIGGSRATGAVDKASDIDLYVYTTSVIPFPKRAALVKKLKATRTDLNLQIWDLGDEWFDAATGIEVDVIYWDTRWIEEQLDRVLVSHTASTGYTTCFWYTIYNSKILYDKNDWFHQLQKKTKKPYPETLRRAIITLNHPVLGKVIPSYRNQIEKAIKRSDVVSINHRVAALLASYFDIIFAVNRVLHPGEKKLLEYIEKHCPKIPRNMSYDVNEVLAASGLANQKVITKIENLLSHLDQLLSDEGFDPKTSLPLRKK